MPAEPDNSRDPGLQPERTSMAWSRTLFVLLVLMSAFSRHFFRAYGLFWLICMAIVTMTLIGVYIFAWQRRNHSAEQSALLSYSSVAMKRWLTFAVLFSSLTFAVYFLNELLTDWQLIG